jgi:predicted RNA-binding Zn ribbon-like protein
MMAVMTDQAAPNELELVRQFVNTLDVEQETDELATAESAAEWLADHDLGARARRLTAADAARLLSVREALRALLLANNSGEQPPAPALGELNREASETAIGLRFDETGSALVTRCGGVDAAIATLLAVVHRSMDNGTWRRLKICPADDCRWAFYDHSRNRSGTWCRMEECGNRAKARAYRERRRNESADSRSR